MFSIIEALESGKPPEKYASADSIVPMTLKIFYSNLKKFTRFCTDLRAIFTNFLFFINCLFVLGLFKVGIPKQAFMDLRTHLALSEQAL